MQTIKMTGYYASVRVIAVLLGIFAASQSALADSIFSFTADDLVISTVSSYNGGGLDSASPIVLRQFQLNTDGNVAICFWPDRSKNG